MTDDLTLEDIALQAWDMVGPGAKAQTYGAEFYRLIKFHHVRGHAQWMQDRLESTLGRFVTDARQRQGQRDKGVPSLALSHDGRPISKFIRVGTQLCLWHTVSPEDWIRAALREQTVIDGRNEANAVRLQLANELAKDPVLLALPTIEAVLEAKGLALNDFAVEDLG